MNDSLNSLSSPSLTSAPSARPMASLAALTALLATTSLAAAAPRIPTVHTVHTSVDEARACLPLPGGGALVGTGGGLVRLDATGAITGSWTAGDGLPGTRIESLVELSAFTTSTAAPAPLTATTPLGELWIGTDDGAARVSFSASGNLQIRSRHGDRQVRDVARLGNFIYFATWSGGVQRIVDGPAATAVPTPVPFRGAKLTGPRAQVSSLAVLGGTLYAGTAAGLYQLAGNQLVPAPLDDPRERPAERLAISALHAEGDTLWIATPDGLFARRGDGHLRHLGGGDLRAVASLGGELVVAGIAEGLERVDRGRLVALPGAPRALTVAQAIGVRGDAVCTGGLEGAWLRGSAEAPWIRAAHRAGPPSNDISALAADGERLWVGTFDRGLALYERGSWRALSHPDIDGRVNAILVEPRPAKSGTSARVWIATANGLSSIDGDDVTRLARADGMPGRGVLALTLLSGGRLLAGTSYGAVIVDGGRSRPARLGPKGGELGNVWAVAQAADGAIWLGTTTGLYRGREGGTTEADWQRFSLASGHLADDWVTALVARGNDVYAGTYKGGIVKLTPGPAPATPPPPSAAPSSAPAPAALSAPLPTALAPFVATPLHEGWINPGGLAFDGNRLLASTMDGLFLGDGASWTKLPGLPGVDVTAAVRLGATLFVSTRRGLAELR